MNKQKQEAVAVERIQLITPLLDPNLDPAKEKMLRQQICQQSGLSDRTIRRYLSSYKESGFEGLKPQSKGYRHSGSIPEELMEQAILLRREVPSRSVAQIIQILEWEGRVEPGVLKRSTLQEHLSKRGFSSRHLRIYSSGGMAARRFQAPTRNSLWHSDIKYGPYLPIGPSGKLQQVYLVVFLDDATRFVLYAAFYPTLDQIIVQDAFRHAIMNYGAPKAVYFDNGKQYRTKWMARACAKMDIKLLYAKPYSPESTGKVEIFNRRIDSFLQEVQLEKPKTLNELNHFLGLWLETCYQSKPHSALKDNQSPETCFRSDTAPLRYLDAGEITNAFLHAESRKVDKTGCISFQGKKYEVGIPYIGSEVNVIYDPLDTRELTIEYENHPAFRVKPLEIGERAGKRPTLPQHLTPLTPEHSRLLNASKSQQKDRLEKSRQVVSYRSFKKEGV